MKPASQNKGVNKAKIKNIHRLIYNVLKQLYDLKDSFTEVHSLITLLFFEVFKWKNTHKSISAKKLRQSLLQIIQLQLCRSVGTGSVARRYQRLR